MDLLTILFGGVLGMFLTIGDGIASDVRDRVGDRLGILVWCVITLVPLLTAVCYDFSLAFVAIVVGSTLSTLLATQQHFEAVAIAQQTNSAG